VPAGPSRLAGASFFPTRGGPAAQSPPSVPPAWWSRRAAPRDRIPRQAFDEAITRLAEPGFSADGYLAREAVSDATELEPVVDAVLAANPSQVDAYRGGKEGLLGFFVGQVMQETQGQANPRIVNELIRARLESDAGSSPGA
jgi:Glu-tRNA(Gln) amidotransferase subunit E-like FAD-binding protein